jgi:nucleotide-binding universal stress UspA family protein
MKYRTVLVAYDESEASHRAVRAAVDLIADDSNAYLHVISVIPSMEENYAYSGLGGEVAGGNPNIIFDAEVLGNLQDTIAEGEQGKMREHLRDDIAPMRNAATLEIAYGTSPATGILSYADSNDCDLIVIGSRGLGVLRGMLGSVSYSVVRSSPVPVLVIK